MSSGNGIGHPACTQPSNLIHKNNFVNEMHDDVDTDFAPAAENIHIGQS